MRALSHFSASSSGRAAAPRRPLGGCAAAAPGARKAAPQGGRVGAPQTARGRAALRVPGSGSEAPRDAWERGEVGRRADDDLTATARAAASAEDVLALVRDAGGRMSPAAAAAAAATLREHARTASDTERRRKLSAGDALAPLAALLRARVPHLSARELLAVLRLCAAVRACSHLRRVAVAAVEAMPPAPALTPPECAALTVTCAYLANAGAAADVGGSNVAAFAAATAVAATNLSARLDAATPAEATEATATLAGLGAITVPALAFAHLPLPCKDGIMRAAAKALCRAVAAVALPDALLALRALRRLGGDERSAGVAAAAAKRFLAADAVAAASAAHIAALLTACAHAGYVPPPAAAAAAVHSALRRLPDDMPVNDLAALAMLAAAEPSVDARAMLPLADHFLRHAEAARVKDVARIVAALLECGCEHEGALAAFEKLAMPWAMKSHPAALAAMAACTASPKLAHHWPAIQVAAHCRPERTALDVYAQYITALQRFEQPQRLPLAVKHAIWVLTREGAPEAPPAPGVEQSGRRALKAAVATLACNGVPQLLALLEGTTYGPQRLDRDDVLSLIARAAADGSTAAAHRAMSTVRQCSVLAVLDAAFKLDQDGEAQAAQGDKRDLFARAAEGRVIAASPDECAIIMCSLMNCSEAARAGVRVADMHAATQRRLITLLRDPSNESWSLDIVTRLLRAAAETGAWSPVATAGLARRLSVMLAQRAQRGLTPMELTNVSMCAYALARRVGEAYGPAPPAWERDAAAEAGRHRNRWGDSADSVHEEGRISAYTPSSAPVPHPQVLRRDALEFAAERELARLEATFALHDDDDEAEQEEAAAAAEPLAVGATSFSAVEGAEWEGVEEAAAEPADGLGVFVEGGVESADELLLTPAAAASEADLRERVRSTLADVADAADVRAAVDDALSAISTAPDKLASLSIAATAVGAARAAYGLVPRALAAWATGPPFVARLAAARGEDAGRSVGKLLAELAAASRLLPPPFRAAATAFTAANAATLSLPTLERLAFGLSRSAPRHPEGPAALNVCLSALQREMLVRAAPSDIETVASMITSLAKQGAHVTKGTTSHFATLVAPRLSTLQPHALVQLTWAFGRCQKQPRGLLRGIEGAMERYADEAALADAPDSVRRSVMHLLTGIPWALSHGAWPKRWAGQTNSRALELLTARPTLLALATPRHLCSMLGGIAVTGAWVQRRQVGVIFEEVRAAPAEEMTAASWANVLHACGRMRYQDWPLVNMASEALAEEGGHACAAKLGVQQVTTVAAAVSALKWRDRDHMLCSALAARMMALLGDRNSAQHCSATAVSQWLFMFGVCSCRHVECLQAISAFFERHPDRSFRTYATMAISLWAYAKLAVPPGLMLDHCMLSAPELLVHPHLTAKAVGRVTVCLWAIAVLRKWDHPLLDLFLRSIANVTDAHAERLRHGGRQQLAQFMLLAAADSHMEAVLAVPESVRDRCIVERKQEVAERVRAERQEDAARTSFDRSVHTALRDLNLHFSRNIASRDGIMHFDYLMHHRPEARLRPKYSAISLELWHNDFTCSFRGDQRALAKAQIRMRLAAARKVLLVPLSFAEWQRQTDVEMRGVYLLQKLRSAGMTAG